MLKKILYIFLILFCKGSFGQFFINGDFEINSAANDQINLMNSQYNNFMSNSFAFGSFGGGGSAGGNMDIVTSSSYCGIAQNGNWYVALTGGGTDAISLTLSSPLVIGTNYTITFYDRMCAPYPSFAIQVGASNVNNNFGNLLYTAAAPIVNGVWTQRTFSFTATISALYITVQCNGIYSGQWTQIDNFSFTSSTPNPNVISKSEIILEMPNIFSPNNDAINDHFLPIESKGIDKALLIIYNRWGEKLFESEDLNKGWDGKLNGKDCPAGTYYWIIRYSDVSKNELTQKGFVSLTQ